MSAYADYELTIRLNDLGYRDQTRKVISYSLNDIGDWLREKKGLHVMIELYPDRTWNPIIESIETCRTIWTGDERYDTHDEALLAGVQAAVKLLKERK